MGAQIRVGGAAAPPLARALIATGARIMLNPEGKIETGGEFDVWSRADPRTARRIFTVSRRFHRRLRDQRFARSVKALVAIEGKPTPNGWLVLKA